MSRRATKAIVVYDPHPHVTIFRELAGYKTVIVDDFGDEDNTAYLRSLDPKNFKTNDHYAVLNLKHLRYRASEEDIRKRYRQLVLQHHPDKRRARGENIKDISHDYFACITQAYEILGKPSKRHAYDSVDPFLPECEPSIQDIEEDFFNALNNFFMEKARWSKHQPTPFLGHRQTPLDLVYRFYDFWEDYETTKDFSFLDEEDKEKGEDRESRRYIERCNRAERQRRRNEELKKIHQIVDLARSRDPRLLAAEKASREAKEARKRERLEAIQKRRAEEEARAKAEAAAAEAARAVDAERQRQEAALQRKEREQAKILARKEKKRLKNICTNQYDHFIAPARAENSSVADGTLKVQTLQHIDLLCHVLSTVELAELNSKLENAGDVNASFAVWKAEVARAQKESKAPGLRPNSESKLTSNFSNNDENSKWTFEMTQLLIKAVNVFPAGTQKRWDVIAAYVNQHVKDVEVTGKEALKQANWFDKITCMEYDNISALTKLAIRGKVWATKWPSEALFFGVATAIHPDYPPLTADDAIKQEANEKAFDSFATSTKQSEAIKSVKITQQIEAEADRPWTLSEQRALERALRAHPVRPGEPSSVRWQHIADEVGTRTLRECLQRFKDLAEQVRMKKAALAAVGVSDKE